MGLSELFADENTLLLYSFMFRPSWDKPCPSCTSLIDGFDRSAYQVTRDAAFVAIAKAPADRINAWAKQRGWSQIALVSGSDSTYQADYKCQEDSDDIQWPVMHVLRKQGRDIFISGEPSWQEITWTRYGPIGISWTYAGGSAGHSHAAAKFQVRILGEALRPAAVLDA